MINMLEKNLSVDDKALLLEVLIKQSYALELVSSEISDIESGRKYANDIQLKQLNDLYDRLAMAGF